MSITATKKITVFLAFSSNDMTPLRNDLAIILQRAGMNVVPDINIPSENIEQIVAESLEKADCSVHVLSAEYAPYLSSNDSISLSRFQFFEAKKRLGSKAAFKVFVWNAPLASGIIPEPEQADFINEVRNNIIKNMVFSNVHSPIQLVEDIRSMTEIQEKVDFSVAETDIFLISNQLDENEANEISELLSDIIPVERLNIVQDSNVDYSELCVQQIGKSKLAVVYFKESGDWAIPFVQQVWKKIGGASSHIPILLIGDEEPDANCARSFKAPKVLSLIVAGELIPLEIKVRYDQVNEEGVLE